MTNYPIISQRTLPKASRRGPMGLVPPRRDANELPLPNAHEAVVYKTAGAYIVDDGRSRTSDEHVVNATNITVVDMREDAPVTVQATIPSAGAAEFVIQVTFLCTVKKPEEVVEAGLHDLTTSLTHYLIRYQKLFHLGEDYQLGQVTAVRHNVTSEVKAYFNVRSARFRGLQRQTGQRPGHDAGRVAHQAARGGAAKAAHLRAAAARARPRRAESRARGNPPSA